MQSTRPDPFVARFETKTSRYMTVGGTRIHYCVEGRGPTLLLLHGEIGSLHSWEGWVQKLAPHYRIVRIDLPGFGLSGHLPSDDYTPEHAIELLDQILAHMHVEEVALAGNSLGGFLAWYYAAHRPERVSRLILVNPIGYPQSLPSWVALASLPWVGDAARLFAPRLVVERCLREVYGDPSRVTAALVDRYHALLSRPSNRAALVKTCRRLRVYRADFELARQISRVRAPTLLMWGVRDRWVPASLVPAWRRDLTNLAVLLYPDAGHMPMEELPEQTAEDAHTFLAGGVLRPSSAELTVDDSQVVPLVYAQEA